MPSISHREPLVTMESDRERRRATFDKVAQLYDRARPGYPEQLFRDLERIAGTGPGCRLLEIGCGTGQLTLPLAQQGCKIVALDLGPNMAAIAGEKLKPYPKVKVIVAAFEDWPLPSEPFDVVASSSAFHWIDPAVRFKKSAETLRPGGALATIGAEHIRGGTEDFFVEAQECYLRWDSSATSPCQLPTPADIPENREDLEGSGLFDKPVFRRYEWDRIYSAAAYRDVLLTYSVNRALPEEKLLGLVDCIAGLIDSRYGGKIIKRYMNELRVAKRLG
jgi:SAM-dependent methyltransferase